MADLLIELFSEEIPARMQAKAADDLKRLMIEGLKSAGLTFEAADAYATPRRLALHVTDIPASTPDISEERRGPRADAPEKAIEGFLRGAGVARDDLVEREDKKGTFLYAIIEKEGRAAAEVIAETFADAVRNFPWPKSQRWGSGSLKWVRPLHSILCLFDGAVVDMDVDGIKAGDSTRGHRFMAPEEFSVTGFADYKQKLLDHKVILDGNRRQTLIRDTAQILCSAAGLDFVEDTSLIAEVAGLVEWPVPMLGSFDASFLEVPEEVLILTMKKDQKYLVTRDPATGKLASKFIFTANIEPSDDGSAVRGGNERVITARLSDAKFFWEQDLKGKLEDNLPALKDIVFHIDLGTVAERVERMKSLIDDLASDMDALDREDGKRAAELSKADLVSGMVYEFPEVQGVMGRYYAQAQGESDAVADAIRDHYAPLGPSDACPSKPVSIAVALAEKLDTLVGFFGIDQKPTGSKDPYALRRAALGVIRLITENGLRLSLNRLFPAAAQLYRNQEKQVSDSSEALLNFFGDRLKVQQRDKGVRHDLIDAVFAKGDDDLVRILNRVAALSAFLESDDGANLLAGYKRAANILSAEEKKGSQPSISINWNLLEAGPERELADMFFGSQAGEQNMQAGEPTAVAGKVAVKDLVAKAIATEDFEGAMAALSALRAPIDTFFDKVIVNADEVDVRANRLALLSEIRSAVNTVADFSKIEG